MLEQNQTYIFCHPSLRTRVEKFGGLAQSDKGLYMLGHDEFKFLCKFCGYKSRKEVQDNIGDLLLEKLLDAGFLIEISQKIANKILLEKGGKSNEYCAAI
ncbi:MAG: hypothetical protein ABIC36_03565 [bacterium]